MSVAARRDPAPLTAGWEVAFVAVSAVLLALGGAAVAGLSLAGALTGRGWVWPHGHAQVVAVVRGLAGGHPGAGMPGAGRHLPGPVLAYCCVGAAEAAAVAATTALAVAWVRYHRPGDARSGMATPAEARDALGVGRLRAARHLIRPDLYTTRTRRGSR